MHLPGRLVSRLNRSDRAGSGFGGNAAERSPQQQPPPPQAQGRRRKHYRQITIGSGDAANCERRQQLNDAVAPSAISRFRRNRTIGSCNPHFASGAGGSDAVLGGMQERRTDCIGGSGATETAPDYPAFLERIAVAATKATAKPNEEMQILETLSAAANLGGSYSTAEFLGSVNQHADPRDVGGVTTYTAGGGQRRDERTDTGSPRRRGHRFLSWSRITSSLRGSGNQNATAPLPTLHDVEEEAGRKPVDNNGDLDGDEPEDFDDPRAFVGFVDEGISHAVRVPQDTPQAIKAPPSDESGDDEGRPPVLDLHAALQPGMLEGAGGYTADGCLMVTSGLESGGANGVLPKSRKMSRFYKTKLCPYLLQQGACCEGENCVYAHSQAELRELPDLWRTKMCPAFKSLGHCEDSSCRFAHSIRELRHTNCFFKTKLCHMWKKGKCSVGLFCRHAHGPWELKHFRAIARGSAQASNSSVDLSALDTAKAPPTSPSTAPIQTDHASQWIEHTLAAAAAANENVSAMTDESVFDGSPPSVFAHHRTAPATPSFPSVGCAPSQPSRPSSAISAASSSHTFPSPNFTPSCAAGASPPPQRQECQQPYISGSQSGVKQAPSGGSPEDMVGMLQNLTAGWDVDTCWRALLASCSRHLPGMDAVGVLRTLLATLSDVADAAQSPSAPPRERSLSQVLCGHDPAAIAALGRLADPTSYPDAFSIDPISGTMLDVAGNGLFLRTAAAWLAVLTIASTWGRQPAELSAAMKEVAMADGGQFGESMRIGGELQMGAEGEPDFGTRPTPLKEPMVHLPQQDIQQEGYHSPSYQRDRHGMPSPDPYGSARGPSVGASLKPPGHSWLDTSEDSFGTRGSDLGLSMSRCQRNIAGGADESFTHSIDISEATTAASWGLPVHFPQQQQKQQQHLHHLPPHALPPPEPQQSRRRFFRRNKHPAPPPPTSIPPYKSGVLSDFPRNHDDRRPNQKPQQQHYHHHHHPPHFSLPSPSAAPTGGACPPSREENFVTELLDAVITGGI